MSNIGNKVKGGAYPIPAEWRDYIWRLFKPFEPSRDKRALILDPFANTGEMLLRGAEMLRMEPYAVELQDPFIEAGRQNMSRFYQERGMSGDLALTRFLHQDAFQLTASNGGFAIVYVNSPFDDTILENPEDVRAGKTDFGGFRRERVESLALNHFFPYVAPNGYMIWVAYAQHMTRKVIQTFRRKCDSLMIFRFPEPHLDHYTLICVVGSYVKGHQKLSDETDAERAKGRALEDWFIDLGKHPEKIVAFDRVYEKLEQTGAYLFPGKINGIEYPPVPRLNIYRGAVLFQGRETDAAAHLELNLRHGAQTLKSFANACKSTAERPLDRPLHKPNKRQMVVNIASGMLDNVELLREGKRALLRGSVRELHDLVDTMKEQIVTKDSSFTRITDTTMIRPEHHIALLYQDGAIEDLSGADQLKALIEENAGLLIENFNARYKPFYDMQIHPVWDKLLSQLLFVGKHKFYKPQKYVTVCTIENLAIRRKQISNAQQGFGKSGISCAVMIGLRLLELGLAYKAGDPVPKLAERFGISLLDLRDLIDNLCQRYAVTPDDLLGIPVTQPVIITVPAIAPVIWLSQETLPMYDAFRPVQLVDANDARKFMTTAAANTDDQVIYLGVISYENAKMNEGREPAAAPRFSRYKTTERNDEGRQVTVIKVEKYPSDPITGEPIRDRKGNILPWRRFTREGRGKSLEFYSGPEFYGYATVITEGADGKKTESVDRSKKRHSTIIPRKLDRDDLARNQGAGYPSVRSRQYPLYSEVRNFGFPKVGNGRAITPMKEVVIPDRMIDQVKYHDRSGYKCKPYLARVLVKGRVIQVPDFEHQVNLVPEEPILDPWLASKGTRFTQSGTRKTPIERAMTKLNLQFYRVGSGQPILDKLLQAEGVFQYRVGVGEIVLKSPRYPVASFLRRFYSGKIALFVADEIHLGKSGSQAEIGQAVIDLVIASKMTNGLTGTYFGGKSSSVFALAYQFDPDIRKEYPWARGAPMRWIEDMGVRKMVESRDVGAGSSLRSGRRSAPRITEAPGASPMLMRVLAKYTLWASLLDLRDKMPGKAELSYEVKFDEDQQAVYNRVFQTLRTYNGRCLTSGDRSFLASYYQNMLSMGDAMHRSWDVIHTLITDKGAARKKYAGAVPTVVCQIPSLGSKLKAKEREALEWLKRDLGAGRRVIISLCQTASRDIQDRWLEIITANVPNAKPFVLRGTSIKPSERSAFIKKKSGEGFNVMIANSGLISVAISITNFSAWYSIEYPSSLYLFSQATARINRPSQERKDIVYRHFYWDDKFQKQAVMNIADKTKAAAVLMGSEGGDLASMMSSESRVVSYETLLEAIETGKQKLKTADEIQAAFSVSNYSEGNWSDSAWWQPGDQEEAASPEEVYTEEEVIDDADEPAPEAESEALSEELDALL